MSRLVRVSDFVRHAQAQGLARRIQSAAKLRSRHRASESKKMTEQEGPNAPMSAPKTRPEGVPHRLLGSFSKFFEALGGLGRFGRVLRLVLHGSWKENVSKMAPSCLAKSNQNR